jgi:S1-C subfamily serine protease
VVDQLVMHGEVRRGQLGVSAQDLTPALAAAFDLPARQGAVVVEVARGSPAARAGLKQGDIVTAINGREVRTAADVRNTVGLLRVGDEVRLDVVRSGKELALQTRIAEPRHDALRGGEVSERLDGAQFGTVESSAGERMPGVAVEKVVQGSPAWNAGLREGDFITHVNRNRVNGLDEFRRAVAASGSVLTLSMHRGNAQVHIVLR